MAFRGDPGAAGGIYNDGDLRQVSPQQQGVADDADIGAESDEGDRFNGGILIQGAQALSQGGAAKGGFINDLAGVGQQPGGQLPAVAAADAVGHRQCLALAGVQVIFGVGISGKEHQPLKGADLPLSPGQHGGRFGGAQGAIDKVILQIDGD